MAELWNAFIQDYADEIHDWSNRQLLEIFWHYCQDGSKAVYKLLNGPRKTKVKEIDRLRKDLEETITTLNHARIFIDSRQKMHKDGVLLYDKCLDGLQQELKERE